jgi:ribose transport system substrate-binding protein
MFTRARFLAIAALSLSLLGCDKSPDSPAPNLTAHKLRLAVIPKGTTHFHWKSVEAGARKAAEERGVEILWKGPIGENDRAQQIAIVEQFVSEGVDGIAVAPLDDVALGRPVRAAMEKKIPVVIFDSGLKGEVGKDWVSYVATNNKLGGVVAGEEFARVMGGKGKAMLLRYMEGSASTVQREAGFLEALAKHPEITLISSNRYLGATAAEAQTNAMNMIDLIKEADGVFASNESATFGLLLALRQNGLAGKIKVVGFDSSDSLIEAMRKGELLATVAQNPKKMGYELVKALVDSINGKPVPESIDSGAMLLTPENLDSPEVKALLGK